MEEKGFNTFLYMCKDCISLSYEKDDGYHIGLDYGLLFH